MRKEVYILWKGNARTRIGETNERCNKRCDDSVTAYTFVWPSRNVRSCVAQLEERQSNKLQAVGSRPTVTNFFVFLVPANDVRQNETILRSNAPVEATPQYFKYYTVC